MTGSQLRSRRSPPPRYPARGCTVITVIRYTGVVGDGATRRFTTNQTHAVRVRLVVFSTPDDLAPGHSSGSTDVAAATGSFGFHARYWVKTTLVLDGLPLCDESYTAHGPGYYTPPEGLYITSDLAWRRLAAGMVAGGDGSGGLPALPALPDAASQDPSTWMTRYQPNTSCAWRFDLPAGAVAKLVFAYLDTGDVMMR